MLYLMMDLTNDGQTIMDQKVQLIHKTYSKQLYIYYSNSSGSPYVNMFERQDLQTEAAVVK